MTNVTLLLSLYYLGHRDEDFIDIRQGDQTLAISKTLSIGTVIYHE